MQICNGVISVFLRLITSDPSVQLRKGLIRPITIIIIITIVIVLTN